VPPQQSRQHQLACREVPAGIGQFGAVDAADLAIEQFPAGAHVQAEFWNPGNCSQIRHLPCSKVQPRSSALLAIRSSAPLPDTVRGCVLNHRQFRRREFPVDFLRPASLAAALAMKAERPEAVPIAGGTDVMVELNFDQRRPAALLDLTGIGELGEWSSADGVVRLGATVPYSRVIGELSGALPALAMAARTVGSPQIRNRGTVGGNLGAASPAGDTHPVLLAVAAQVEVASLRGTRTVPAERFYTGVKANALAPDELITAIHLPVAAGPQQFAKVGTRNAMVIAVCSFALALHPAQGRAGAAIGSAAPTPRRAAEAERFLACELDWDAPRPLPDAVCRRFGELVAAASDPIDDVRGSAGYRRHALAVLARRTLSWAWDERRGGDRPCA
jgi:CO/xanthine dehydrogenase FAD-binding subunit